MSTMTLKNAKGEGDFLRLRFWGAVLLMLGALLALGAGSVNAATLAGTTIGNQASASYKDNNNVDRITVSNSVSTVVQAVGSANLVQTQSKIGAPGQTLAFAHTITNTGNSSDTFTVTIGAQVNTVGNAFAAATTGGAVYADANCDGVADSNTTTTSLGPVAPGGQICFVAQVALGVTGGNSSNFPVGYSSSIAGATLLANGVAGTTNTDTVTISANAVINVSKSINIATGPSGTIVTYQLTYRNTGTVSAGNVVIADLLPAGATYVAGSGRWSAATGTPLTDAALNTDAGAANASPYRIDYSLVGTTINAIIERVDPGVQGIIQFQATMAGVGPLTITNQTEWCYNDIGINGTVTPAAVAGACSAVAATAEFNAGGTPAAGNLTTLSSSTTNPNVTNLVPFFIPQSGATGIARITDTAANSDGTNPTTTALSVLIPTGANVAGDDLIVTTAGQGTLATWSAFVTNGGTGTDTFNITVLSSTGAAPNFPVGTTFLLFRSDGFTPLTDSNNDGILDTGPLGVGVTYPVIIYAVLPPGGSAGVYDAIIQAQSTNPNPVVAQLTNTVAVRANVIGSRVDLTNNNAAGVGQTAAGEATPQTTVAVNPGTVATFGLIVNNTGTVADSFDLSYNLGAVGAGGVYSNTSPFAFTTPSQFTGSFVLTFYLDNGTTCAANQLGAAVSNTGVIAPLGLKRVCALVSVPSGAPAGNTNIFFRVLSPSTFSGNFTLSSGDVKYDMLTVNIFRTIGITPNNSGQVFPNGSIQYCHTVANGGNVAETLTVTQANQSLFGTGTWAQFATVYADTNKNCVLDGVENASPLTLTVVNSIVYNPATTTNFIVVVQAPGSAAAGQVNVNTFTLSSVSGATGNLVATDTTSVVIGQVQLVKDQVLDNTGTACNQTWTSVALDGVAATFVQTPLSVGAIPGSCIIYRVRATNVGTQNVTGVVINDVAPPNSTLVVAPSGALSSVATPCAPTTAAPNVSCTISPLTGGSTTTMYFRVKIN